MFNLFDVKRNGVIEFGEFVRSLSIFHPKASEADKIACKIYYPMTEDPIRKIFFLCLLFVYDVKLYLDGIPCLLPYMYSYDYIDET